MRVYYKLLSRVYKLNTRTKQNISSDGDGGDGGGSFFFYLEYFVESRVLLLEQSNTSRETKLLYATVDTCFWWLLDVVEPTYRVSLVSALRQWVVV